MKPPQKPKKQTKSSNQSQNLLAQESYAYFFTNVPIGIYRTTPDGKILLANPALVRMLGYTSFEELTKRNLEHGVFEPTYPRKQFKELMEKEGEINGLEYSWIRRDGSVIFIRENAKVVRDADNNILYYEGTVEDITEHKRADEELKQSHDVLERQVHERTVRLLDEIKQHDKTAAELQTERDKMQRYLDVAGVMFVVINADGTVSLINKKGCEVLGCTEEEILGKNWFDCFIPLNIREKLKTFFSQLFSEKTTLGEYHENPILTNTGEERIIAWHNTVIRDKTGVILSTLSSGEDITDRKKAEQQQRSITEGLQHVLAAADELILTPDLDTLYRRAVEIGREKLGLERCSIYIEKGDIVHGTYGTDQHGQTTDERAVRDSIERWKKYLQTEEKENVLQWSVFEEPRHEWDGQKIAELETGWLVATPIKSARGRLGVFFNDAGITSKPLDPAKQEVVAVYCSLLGSIIERRRVVQALGESEQRYRVLFEDSPISLWKEDFSTVKQELDRLANSGITDFKTYFNSHPEEVIKCAGLIKIIEVNKATLELYHAANPEELHQGLPRIFSEESYPIFIEELVAIAEGKTSFEQEAINLTLTGEKKHIIIRWSVAPGFEKTLSTTIVSIFDITARKQAEAALQKSEETYRTLVENINDIIYTIDPSGVVTYISPALEHITGYTADEVLGKPFTQFIHPDDILSVMASVERGFAGQQTPLEFKLIDKNNLVHYARASSRRLVENGEVKGFIGILSDITDRKQMEEELRSLSLIDELTGLYNRRGFQALAEQQIKIAHRLEKRMLLLFADIDNLKRINDTYGHLEGDRALIDTTKILRDTFRESDIIARIGGDEFVILAIEIDASSADILTARLQETLEEQNAKASRSFKLAVSIGIARYVPESPRPLNELLEQADKLMYQQKRKKQPENK
jgi:diguanylate cyclase (GGDEF)-like protein/PAS domain S-box-containing protein